MTLSSILFHSPIPFPVSGHRFQSNTAKRTGYIRLRAKKSNSPTGETAGSQSDNVVLRAAWYGSELLGIAASYLRPNPSTSAEVVNPVEDGLSGPVAGRVQVVEAIKQDYHRSYFVSGNLTLSAYEEDCEFADPAGSFRGLSRFKRNCSNFGSLLLKSNMKLTKWEDFEDKGVGHWRFSCVMSFPWRPILSGILHNPRNNPSLLSQLRAEATGYTEYYFDNQSGKVCRHVENWNVPKMALLKQIFRPTRWVWGKE